MNQSHVARVHTDAAGKVWLRAEGDPRCVGDVQDFLRCPEFGYCKEVWTVGDRCNAELITEMWPHRNDNRRIRIGSPSVCPTSQQREDPYIVLSKIDELCGAASSVGGFLN